MVQEMHINSGEQIEVVLDRESDLEKVDAQDVGSSQ